jgi:hypothetical protein
MARLAKKKVVDKKITQIGSRDKEKGACVGVVETSKKLSTKKEKTGLNVTKDKSVKKNYHKAEAKAIGNQKKEYRHTREENSGRKRALDKSVGSNQRKVEKKAGATQNEKDKSTREVNSSRKRPHMHSVGRIKSHEKLSRSQYKNEEPSRKKSRNDFQDVPNSNSLVRESRNKKIVGSKLSTDIKRDFLLTAKHSSMNISQCLQWSDTQCCHHHCHT